MGDLDACRRAFVRHLQAERKSPATVTSYDGTVRRLLDWLAGRPDTDDLAAGGDGAPRVANLDELTRAHIETYLGQMHAAGRAPSSVLTAFAGLQAWAKWATDPEDEVIAQSFMAGVGRPTIPESEPPSMTDDELAALLATAAGPSFVARRDTAIIRVFSDCGVRAAECAGLTVHDVDLDDDVIRVIRKGRHGARKTVALPFGAKTGQALARYARLRSRLPNIDRTDAWWIGTNGKGTLTHSGIRQMLERRAAEAGLEKVHPHLLRHTSVDAWLAAGGSEGDAMRLFGWRSREMLDRYARKRQHERATEAHRRLSPGDRI